MRVAGLPAMAAVALAKSAGRVMEAPACVAEQGRDAAVDAVSCSVVCVVASAHALAEEADGADGAAQAV